MRKPFSKFGLLFSKTETPENNQKNVPLNGYVKYLLRKEQENSKKGEKSKRKQNSIEAISSFHIKTGKKHRGKSMKDKCLEDTYTRKKRSKPATLPSKEDALVLPEHNPNVLFISPEDIVKYRKHLKKFKNNTADVLHKVPQLEGKNHDHYLEDILIFNSVKDFGKFRNRLPNPENSITDMTRRAPGSSSRDKRYSKKRSSETNDGNWLSKKELFVVNDKSQHIINYNINTESVKKCSISDSDRNVHRKKKESHRHGKDTKKNVKDSSKRNKSLDTKAQQAEKPQTGRRKSKTEASKTPKNTNRKGEPDLKDYIGNIQGILNRNLFSFLKDLPQESSEPRKEEELKQKHRDHKHKSKRHHHQDHHHKTEQTKLDKTELIKQYLRNHDFGEGPAQSKLPEQYRKPFIKSFPNWNSKDQIPEPNYVDEESGLLDKSYNEKNIDQLLEKLDSTGCLIRKVCPVLEIIPMKSLHNRSSRRLAATYSQVLEKKKHSVAFRNYYRYTSQMATSNSDSNRICQSVSEPSTVDGTSEIQKSNNKFQSKIPLLKISDSRAPAALSRSKFAASSTKSPGTPPKSPTGSKTTTADETLEPKAQNSSMQTKSKIKPKAVVHTQVEKTENSIQTDSEKQESTPSLIKRSTGKSPRLKQKVISSKRSLQSQLGKSRDAKRATGVTFSFDQAKKKSSDKVKKPMKITTAKLKQYDNASQADELPPSIKSIDTSTSNVTEEKRPPCKISKFYDNRKTRTTSVSFVNNNENNLSKIASVYSDNQAGLQVDDSEEIFNEDYCDSEPAQSIDICNPTPIKDTEKLPKPWSNSNSYSYSLERFAAKSAVMSDMTKNHTTLLLTKSYRDADQVSRLKKRKLYGETVRQNLMLQANPMKIPPQVVEVRFVTSIRKNSQVTLATPNKSSAGSLRRHKTCLGLCKDKRECCKTVVEQPKPSVTLSKSHQSIDILNPFNLKSSKPKVCHSNNAVNSNYNSTEENKINESDVHKNKGLQIDDIKVDIPIEETNMAAPLLSKSSGSQSKDVQEDVMSCCKSQKSLVLNQEMSEARTRSRSGTNVFATEENEGIPCTQTISRDQFDELFEMPIDDAFNDILNENYKFLEKDFSYKAPKVSIEEIMSGPNVAESQKTSRESLSRWYHCTDSPYEALTHSNIDEIFRNNKFETGQFLTYDSRSQERIADSFSVPGSEESGYATAKSKETSAAEKFFQRPSIKALLGTSLSSFDEDMIRTRLEKGNLDNNDFGDEVFPDESTSTCSTDSGLKYTEYFNPFDEESIEGEAKEECMEVETREECTKEEAEPEEVQSEGRSMDDSKEVEFDQMVELELVPEESIPPSCSSSSSENCEASREELKREDSNRDSNVFAETELSLIGECSEKDDELCEINSMGSLEKKANKRKKKRSAWIKKIKNVFRIHHKK